MVDIHRGADLTDGPQSRLQDEEGADDATAWRAARIILTRVVAEPSYAELDASLRLTIERFLERHPAWLGGPARGRG
jgi:hypothetical protein